MAAILAPKPAPESVRRPALRVIEGGRSPRRMVIVYRRRRAVALVLVVALGVAVLGGVRAALAAVAPAPPGATATAPVDGPSVVVRPGDTPWSLAQRIVPGKDPRAVVDRLAAARGSRPLQAGERVPVALLAPG